MSKTIVQAYGPIYGEPVNGTVMGRPNGSVYVPTSNVINLSVTAGMEYFKKYGATQVTICTSSGTVPADSGFSANAVSQDLASNIAVEIFSDAALTTQICAGAYAAGRFDVSNARRINVTGDISGLSAGDKLYLRAKLMNNGTDVAISNVIEVEWVV